MLKSDRDHADRVEDHADRNGDQNSTVVRSLSDTGAGSESRSLIEALAREAGAEELARHPLPSTYLAAHICRDDERMFEGDRDKDVRRSIHLGEVPLPKLAPDEVLVGVMASAINYNTVWSATFEPMSTFLFLKHMARRGGWEARHDLPYHVIGSDASGVIVAVGEGVRKWSVGDRVVMSPGVVDHEDPLSHVDSLQCEEALAWGFETNFGGLAHFAVVKVSQLLAKPRHLTWEEAACNTLCGITAYRMLVSPRGAQLKQGDLVLIWGATGGLGAYAVQLVRNGGGIAIGVVSSERKARLLEQLGCDLILRRDELGLDGLGEVELGKRIGNEIRRHFGEDPHIVFEHVGRETFGASVYVTRKGGTVVTCGSSSGYRHEYDNRRLWMRVKRIVGSHAANWQEAWEMNRLIQRGAVIPTLSCIYPLEQVAEATREVQLNRHAGKVGILCLAEREGLGIEDHDLRASIGEERLRLFRDS